MLKLGADPKKIFAKRGMIKEKALNLLQEIINKPNSSKRKRGDEMDLMEETNKLPRIEVEPESRGKKRNREKEEPTTKTSRSMKRKRNEEEELQEINELINDNPNKYTRLEDES